MFQGIPELKEKLFNITLQQEYMGEHIPAVWLTFEGNIARLVKPALSHNHFQSEHLYLKH